MRIMTNKELCRVFHLREHGSNSRMRKKNHNRALKYLRRFGFMTKECLEGKSYDY